ncbi:flagellar L-ring protein FlgH [Roseivivax marinus]|uniref:Flagellar L-ring protein n=1 Tax=Roseivivax marinus TaxID=1379903 RepID=W4HHL6_9RHOB|nr:flagellar basal body L-ring protein FlgH [Roseivivax marinus]ETW11475.1 flagellar L-ring protein FlgH [Roseivivax marinus]UMA66881.1 flagellar basal body L-ring protein FlgH [Roseivivax marinus]
MNKKLAGTMLVLMTVAGCGGSTFHRDPQVSQVGSGTAEVERVQVPMPPPQVEVPAYRAERSSLWGTNTTAGFFADNRAEDVGDLLTIVIDIEDQARLRNATTRSREGEANIGSPSIFGYGRKLHNVLPGVDADDIGDDLVGVTAGQSVQGSGSINRNESISVRVAALVVEKLPNNNLVVKGRQEVKVNQELRDLRVAGIIRPEDIQRDNSIPYDKIAEARISYGGRGQISRQQERSYGEDVLDVILPY